MNWSVDWAWWNADAREQALSDRIQKFFQSKGISTYGNLFQRDGIQVGNDHSMGLVAMNAVASLASTQPGARQSSKRCGTRRCRRANIAIMTGCCIWFGDATLWRRIQDLAATE